MLQRTEMISQSPWLKSVQHAYAGCTSVDVQRLRNAISDISGADNS
jgi:hypothetical protein